MPGGPSAGGDTMAYKFEIRQLSVAFEAFEALEASENMEPQEPQLVPAVDS